MNPFISLSFSLPSLAASPSLPLPLGNRRRRLSRSFTSTLPLLPPSFCHSHSEGGSWCNCMCYFFFLSFFFVFCCVEFMQLPFLSLAFGLHPYPLPSHVWLGGRGEARLAVQPSLVMFHYRASVFCPSSRLARRSHCARVCVCVMLVNAAMAFAESEPGGCTLVLAQVTITNL